MTMGSVIPRQSYTDTAEQIPFGDMAEAVAIYSAEEDRIIEAAVQAGVGASHHRRREAAPHSGPAQIVGHATVGWSDKLYGHVASLVDAETGLVVVAEGLDSRIGAETIVRATERVMANGNAQRIYPTAVMNRLHAAFAADGPVVAAVNKARSIVSKDPNVIDDDALPLGQPSALQLTRDRWLAYNVGEQSVFVQPPMGQAQRLQSCGMFLLDSGPNVIVSITGNQAGDIAALAISNAVQEGFETVDPNEDLAEKIAQAVSAHLAQNEPPGEISVVIVDVEPWKDERSRLRKILSPIVQLPSTLAYAALIRTAYVGRGRRGRQLRETDSRAGRLGRIAAAVGDLALDTAFLPTLYNTARNSLQFFGVHVPLPHWNAPWPHYEPQLSTTHRAAPATAHVAPQTAGSIMRETLQPGSPGMAPPPSVEAAPPKPSFPQLYEALSVDPANHGRASSIDDISKQMLIYYGHQANLPQHEIDKLTKNPRVIAHMRTAFMNDTNANNARISGNGQLNAKDRYSTVAGAHLAQMITTTRAHDLKLYDPVIGNPVPLIEPVPPAPVPAPVHPAPQPRATPAVHTPGWGAAGHYIETATWPEPTAIAAVSVVGGAALAGNGWELRKRRKDKKSQPKNKQRPSKGKDLDLYSKPLRRGRTGTLPVKGEQRPGGRRPRKPAAQGNGQPQAAL